MLPSSYMVLSWLIDLDDFYWIVTLTFLDQGHMVFYVNFVFKLGFWCGTNFTLDT